MLAQLKSLALYGVVALVALWIGGLVRAWPMVSTDSQVADRTVSQLDGQAHSLLSGKPQLLYLYAPWCQICKLTIDGVGSVGDGAVSLVAQSYDSIEQIKQFALDYPAAEATLLASTSLSAELGVPAYPAYVLVSGEGQVLARRVGYMPGWLLRLYLWWYEVY